MRTTKSGDPGLSAGGPYREGNQQSDELPAGDYAVGEADEGSFPASDAPGWITQTTIGPPTRCRASIVECPVPPGAAAGPAAADARQIIVTQSNCHACSTYTVFVHHQGFPELRIEDVSAERAALHLAGRLEAARATTTDALHREAVRRAIDDVRAFLDREGADHVGREIRQHTV